MSKNFDSPTKLTEFPPLSPEAEAPGVGNLLARFFRRDVFGRESSPPSNAGEATSGNTNPIGGGDRDRAPETSVERGELTSCTPSNLPFPIYSEMGEGRSLPNVLRRISNLVAMKKTGLQDYKDTDFKQYWMPDSVSKECYECGDRFTTFRRRHHCRVCGQIFCSRCCNQEIPGKIMGCTGDLRVCTYCCKVVLSYLQSADIGADLSADLRAVQEDLQSKFGDSSSVLPPSYSGSTIGASCGSIAQSSVGDLGRERTPGSSRTLSRRKHSYQEDRFALGRGGHLTSPSSYLASEELQLSAEERWLALQGSASLRGLWEDLRKPETGVPLQTHRYRLRSFPACFVGSELVDWLLAHNRAATMVQSVALGQALMDGGYLECISHLEPTFQDGYALYRLRQQTAGHFAGHPPAQSQELSSPLLTPSGLSQHGEPLWAKHGDAQDSANTDSESEGPHPQEPDPVVGGVERGRLPSSSSTFYLNLNVQENKVQLLRPKPGQATCSPAETPEEEVKPQSHDLSHTGISKEFLTDTLLVESSTNRELVPSMGWHKVQHLRTDNRELEAYNRLGCAFTQHEQCLLQQLLSVEGLSQSWGDTLTNIVHQVVDLVKPDVKNEADDMDIRQYVQFKKVPGGTRSESVIINGVVCSKNVAHRSMSSRLTNPRVLLLGCSIAYERVEGKLLSLEPLIMQEQDYLKNVVARIVSLKPHIVMVERTVSRIAQELLLDQGITLVLNVKPSVLERLARCTQADIVSCVDAHVGKPRIGMCHNFYVKSFLDFSSSKTLMFFDGCATHLGCTVLLRGGSTDELRRLKKVITHMVLVNYSWRQEKSFLMDEFALPPSAPADNFFADEDSLTTSKEEDHAVKFQIGSTINEENSMYKDLTLSPDVAPDNILNKTFHPDHHATEISSQNISLVLDREKKQLEDSNITNSQIASPPLSDVKARSESSSSSTEARDDAGRGRKDAKGNEAKAEAVVDQSDPLHQYLATGRRGTGIGEDVTPSPGSNLVEATLPLTNRFRKALDDTVLSSSPYLQFSVPFLETEAGRLCSLRRFFPEQVFWSPQLDPDYNAQMEVAKTEDINNFSVEDYNKRLKPYHPFVLANLTKPLDSWEVQTLLASFRATGGRLLPPEDNKLDSQEEEKMTPPAAQPEQPPWPQVSHVDALSPLNHQRLPVLFCSFSSESSNAPAFCVNPWVVHMELYGRNDIPLGQFLDQYCFRKSYACPAENCSTPMLRHIRRFVHEGGCVQVSLKELDSVIPVEGNAILMWSWCHICKLVSPVVPMSLDTWSLSFAKYLELRFHGQMYQRRGKENTCQHSLHHEHLQYFGYRDVVASFKYTSVAMWEVSLPSPTIVAKFSPQVTQAVVDEAKQLAWQGYEVFSAILEKLCTMAAEPEVGTSRYENISGLKGQLQREHSYFKGKVEELQLKLTSPTLTARITDVLDRVASKEMWEVDDCLVQLKRIIAEAVSSWNLRILDLSKKKHADSGSGRLVASSTLVDSFRSSKDFGSESAIPVSPSLARTHSIERDPVDCRDELSPPLLTQGEILLEASQDSDRPITSSSESGREWSSGSERKKNSTSLDVDQISETDGLSHGYHQDLHMMSFSSPTVEGLEAGLGVNRAWAEEHQYVLVHHSEVPDEDLSQQQEVKGHERSHSEGDSRNSAVTEDLVDTSKISERKNPSSSVTSTATVKNIISQLLPSTVAAAFIICPLSPLEHALLPCTSGPPVVVYETEPSSIIAYALGSEDYKRKLQELTASADPPPASPSEIKRKTQELGPGDMTSADPSISRRTMLSFLRGGSPTSSTNRERSSSSPSSGGGRLTSTPLGRPPEYDGVQYVAGAGSVEEEVPFEIVDSKSKSNSKSTTQGSNIPCPHIDIQFSDSSTSFQCRAYLAEQFVSLRTLVCPEGEESYVRSLTRCVTWAARGGKSGSAFCKTKDDRFILKEMSRHEVQLFLEIAPSYLSYMKRALEGGQPTLLGKIVGVYRVGHRTPTNTASNVRTNLLVMENLFYARSVTQRFDLKGSVRNRLVEPNLSTPGGEIVLLDENLLKMSCDSPLYIQPHSKLVLNLAIERDTQFLASQAVMDYSLLVGLDEEKKELVVGIIDYIRTFTWDKKLETMVKSSGILGGQGKLPTVVSPELYQSRFMAAMHRYFLPVPDRWTGLGRGVDC